MKGFSLPVSLQAWANLGLRCGTLLSRFLLIFILARYLQPAEVGLYGLLTASISYALYPVGLDFYTYTTREIIKSPREVWGTYLKNQVALAAVSYLVFLPPMLMLFSSGELPWSLSGVFFLLLVLEHLAQEINRLLVAISKQLLASWVLFLRMGAWALMASSAMAINTDTRSLFFVAGSWASGALVACFLGLFCLSRLGIGGWRAPVDWRWIWKGVKTAMPLLVSSLALRGLGTIDRYWMGSLNGLDVLGAYVLFIGMATALASFLDAGVFVFIYPTLIAAVHQGDAYSYRRAYKKLAFHTVFFCLAFSIASLLTVGPLLAWLGKSAYLDQQMIFPYVLVAMILYSLGMIPHYGLYAQHQDRMIVRSHLLGVVVFASTTLVLSRYTRTLAVPLGLCCAYLSIFSWKLAAYCRLTPQEFRVLGKGGQQSLGDATADLV